MTRGERHHESYPNQEAWLWGREECGASVTDSHVPLLCRGSPVSRGETAGLMDPSLSTYARVERQTV